MRATHDRAEFRKDLRGSLIGWGLSTPYALHTVILFLIPLCWGIWLSTMDWNLISEARTFVGFGNFIRLLGDSRVRYAFRNSFAYVGVIVTLSSVFGILIALLEYALPKKIRGVISILFFIPYLTSGVATSVLVKYCFAYNSVLNTFLRERLNIQIGWFSDGRAAFFVITLIVVWKLSGYYALFYLSAIESIPEEVHEAARLDGAVGWRKLRYVILPMILPTVSTVVALASGLSFRIYTEPFLLTGGSDSTTTWLVEIYNVSFVKFKSGYGTAMSILFAIQMFIVLRLINRLLERLNERYGC